MMIRHYAAAALLAVGVLSFALSGCALVEKLETISDAQKAVGSAGAAVAAIRDKDASVLTKAQLVAWQHKMELTSRHADEQGLRQVGETGG